MAEQKAAAPATETSSSAAGGGNKNTFLLLVLAIVNMVVVAGVGFMIWQGKKKDAAEPKIEHVIKGEAEAQAEEAKDTRSFGGKIIPLETFIVNLAGSKGRRVAKVNIELQVTGENIPVELEQRKAQMRDIIIIILSGKTYDQVASKDGKDQLREEIKDHVNAFLTKGKIENVFFTEFIYN